MKPKKNSYYAMYSPLINNTIGKCTGESIRDGHVDLEDIFIEITEEQFDNEELTYEEIKNNRKFQAEITTKVRLEEVEYEV